MLRDMPSMNEQMKAYVRHVLKETGLSASGLANYVGISSTTLTRPLNDKDHKFALATTTIQKIATKTGINPAPFIAMASGAELADYPLGNSIGQPMTLVPAPVLTGVRRLPIYSGAQGGDGKLIITFDEIDRLPMPAALENVAGAYGILVAGDSMVPAFEPGDVAWVHPHLPPQRDKNVILYHTPPDRESEAIIKRLKGWNDRSWNLEQWNPHLEFSEFRKEWPICHRVVGKYDAA